MNSTRLLFASDVFAFARKVRFTALQIAGLTFVLAFALLLFIKDPLFLAQASFQKAPDKIEEEGSFRSFLRNMHTLQDEASILSILQSKMLIASIVQQLGMQVVPCRESRLHRLENVLRAEWGRAPKLGHSLVCSDVDYRQERILKCSIHPIDAHAFQIFDEKNALLAEGTVGKPVVTEQFKIVVDKLPTEPQHFYFQPLHDCVAKQRKELKLRTSRFDPRLIEVVFSHADRTIAQQFVDRLMEGYQLYMIQEHAKLAENQLAFLQQRKQQLQHDYESALQDHTLYLKKVLGNEEMHGWSQSEETWTDPQDEYVQKLNTLDMDLRRWQEIHRSRQLLVHATQDQDKPSTLLCEGSFDLTLPLDPQFVGIDLSTAQKFYAEYSCQKDGLIADLKELSHLRTQLLQPRFEITALSKVMQDSVSQELVQKAAEISLQLCEGTGLTGKEQDRLKESLAAQKKFLLSHLQQTVELLRMKLALVDRKMASLQKAAVELIRSEQTILQEKLQELRKKADLLPERWRLENQLKLKREMTLLIMQEMAQLTESKLVDHHLYAVSSHPLDFAYASPLPKKPYLFLISLGTSLLSTTGWFILRLFRAGAEAVNLTASSLRSLGAAVFPRKKFLERLLIEKPQVVASMEAIAEVVIALEGLGYRVKALSTPTVSPGHRSYAAQLSQWRQEYDFILIETRPEDLLFWLPHVDQIASNLEEADALLPIFSLRRKVPVVVFQ